MSEISQAQLDLDLDFLGKGSIVAASGGTFPENDGGGEIGDRVRLSVCQTTDDGIIHCCFVCDWPDSCEGMAFDEITGREVEPHALPEIRLKQNGSRIIAVESRVKG